MPTPMPLIRETISALANILSKRARSVFSTLPRSGRIACVLLSRPDLAEPPAELPSTIYSSHLLGSRLLQSASLPGRLAPSSGFFANNVLAGRSSGATGSRCQDGLVDNLLGCSRILL